MNRKIAPNTPPAETPEQALHNVEALLGVRSAGWDRTVTRDIIKVGYGSTENFAKHHLAILRWMVANNKSWEDRTTIAGTVA